MPLDYDAVELMRLKDRSSPGWRSPWDRLRSWWRLKDAKISSGPGVTVKAGVKINICPPGQLSIGEGTLLHQGVCLFLTMPSPCLNIGRHVYIGMDTIIAAKQSIVIGDYTIFAPRCYVIDHEHGFDRQDIILNQRSILKSVTIGKDCYSGTGSVVTAGVSIGDGVVIGAGSIVVHDIPAGQVWAGNPARFIRER